MFKNCTEEKMTPKLLAIMEKYKGTNSNMMEVANPSCCGDGDKTRRKKRKTLKEALLHNKCQVRNLEVKCSIRMLNSACIVETYK